MANVVEAPVNAVEDEQGLWTLPKREPPVPVALDFPVKVVKFFAPTRTCPIHGETKVVDRDFQPKYMFSVEGLECGHTLLISRVTDGLKPIEKSPPTYPSMTEAVLGNQRNWKHKCWHMSFKETIRTG